MKFNKTWVTIAAVAAILLCTFSSTQFMPRGYKSLVATEFAKNSLRQVDVVPHHKYKRSECPKCHGSGKLRSGDGLYEQDCPYCEPEISQSAESAELENMPVEQVSKSGPIVTYDKLGNERTPEEVAAQVAEFRAKGLRWNTEDGKCHHDCLAEKNCTCQWPLQSKGITYQHSKEEFSGDYKARGIFKEVQSEVFGEPQHDVKANPVSYKQMPPEETNNVVDWNAQRRTFEEKHLKWNTPNGKCSSECICDGMCFCMYPWQCLGLTKEESMVRLKKLNDERAASNKKKIQWKCENGMCVPLDNGQTNQNYNNGTKIINGYPNGNCDGYGSCGRGGCGIW